MRHFVLIIIIFLTCKSYSNTIRAPKPLDIGRDLNSGFENLTCSEMIASHLSFVAQSPYNPEKIKREFDSCVTRERSNLMTGLLNRAGYVSEGLKECLNVADRAAKEYRDIKNQFVHLLRIREEIYHVNNLSDRSFLADECRNVTPAALKRSSDLSDYDYWRKLYTKCSLKYSAEPAFHRKFRESYRNPNDFAEQNNCLSYRIEYHKDDIRFALPANNQLERNAATESQAVSGAELRCQSLSCSKIMNPNGYNNPSPCYRNALLNCMSGIDANSGAEISSGRRGVSTGN